MQGMSLSDIANELHTTASDISNTLTRQYRYESQLMTDEAREGILALENARLDYLLRVIWPQVQYGDLKAVAEARHITETRIKINNLDKIASSQTTQVLVIGGESQDYLQKLKELSGE